MKNSQFTEKKFNSIPALYEWLEEMGAAVVHFKDFRQDLTTLWVHETGEILHANFNTRRFNGQFVDMEKLSIGSPIRIWDNENGKYEEWNGLVVESLQLSVETFP